MQTLPLQRGKRTPHSMTSKRARHGPGVSAQTLPLQRVTPSPTAATDAAQVGVGAAAPLPALHSTSGAREAVYP